MTEQYLMFIWENMKLPVQMSLLDGQKISVVHPGTRNTDEGPDFFQARVRIGDTLWVGNVEVHVRTSDWLKHKHQHHAGYDNVILHVVYENDIVAPHPLLNIPTLELRNYIDVSNYMKYQKYISSSRKILCEPFIREHQISFVEHWLANIFQQRLQRRERMIRQMLGTTLMNIEETFYHWMCWSMGFKLNNDALLLLARSLPLKILLRHQHDIFQIEALLFGQAGLLQTGSEDLYLKELQNIYSVLAHKYNLMPIQSGVWKFMRTRPSNYPTLRIAQLAALIPSLQQVLGQIMKGQGITLHDLRHVFDIEVSDYWKHHYYFGKPMSRQTTGKLTFVAQNHIIINVVVPFLYMYAQLQQHVELENWLVKIMKQLPPEKNSIVSLWEKAGIKPTNALESQALIELYNHYCSQKRCLECNLGATIILEF